MTRLRGDDELFSLLDVMGGENVQENQEPAAVVEEDQFNASAGNHRVKTEQGGSRTSDLAYVPEAGWNTSIWNPYMDVADPTCSARSTSLLRAEEQGNMEADGSAFTGGDVRRVSPREEILRHQAVAFVFTRFQVLCKELGITVKNETFERWQFSQKLQEDCGGDPILPRKILFDQGLDAELQELGIPSTQSRNVCGELGRACRSALKTLEKQLRLVPASWSPSPSPSRGGLVTVKKVDGATFLVQLGKNRLRINSAHYDKMKELFRRAGSRTRDELSQGSTSAPRSKNRGNVSEAWVQDFHDCLFACLMRYEALQGGGFQASMAGDTFDVLLKHLGVKMECFASPFNCRYRTYCSAFLDTDAPFGSVGSFFDFYPTEGAYQANPPFVREVILKTADHIHVLLEGTSKPLTFVVVIPCWDDAPGWRQLKQSTFLSWYLQIDQKEHVYCEGKQHLRRNRYRLASFHTSVFFLQTPAASKASPVSKELRDDLRSSFAPRHEGGAEGGASFLGRDEKEDGLVNTQSVERNQDPAGPLTGSRSRHDRGLARKGGGEREGPGEVVDATGGKVAGEAPGGTTVEGSSSIKPHATKDDKMTASRERGCGGTGPSRKRRGTRAPDNRKGEEGRKGEGSMGMTYQVGSSHEMSSGTSSVSYASGTNARFDVNNEMASGISSKGDRDRQERKQAGRAGVDTKSHRKKRRRR